MTARADLWCRQRVLDNRVEAAEHRAVEQLRMVGRRDEQALRLILLQELQERVEHAANLAHVVVAAALAAERVDLVEEVDATSLGEGVEDEPELRSRLTHELRDQSVQPDHEQR